jgi:hypothetical protein
MESEHNPGNLLQLRHLVWELAGRPLGLRCRGEGQGVQLEGWLAGPGFGAYKTAGGASRCGSLHLRPCNNKVEVASSPMAESDYRGIHRDWAGPKDKGGEPPPRTPAYARGGPAAEWVVKGGEGCAAGPARVRLHWTAGGKPRWSTLRPDDPDWSRPHDHELYVDLAVEGRVKLRGAGGDHHYLVDHVALEPSAGDMARLRRLLSKRRLAAM